MQDPYYDATGAGTWTVEVRCVANPACASSAQADVVAGQPTPVVTGGQACNGSATLDASGSTAPGCTGGLEYLFRDPMGGLAQDWSTDATFDADVAGAWTVEVRCASDVTCTASAQAVVAIEATPDPFAVNARDVSPCNAGVLLEWPAAIPNGWDGPSWGTNGRGTFDVFRSDVSCADALTRPAVATGVTVPRWFDTDAATGASFYYVVVAEAALPATSCPPGVHRGAPFTQSCVAIPISDEVSPPPPGAIGPSLRVTKPNGFPLLDWTRSPPLPFGQSDVVFGSTNAQLLLPIATGVLSEAWEHQPATERLLYYQIFRANECGTLSTEPD
jgi:hypothetical protein